MTDTIRPQYSSIVHADAADVPLLAATTVSSSRSKVAGRRWPGEGETLVPDPVRSPDLNRAGGLSVAARPSVDPTAAPQRWVDVPITRRFVGSEPDCRQPFVGRHADWETVGSALADVGVGTEQLGSHPPRSQSSKRSGWVSPARRYPTHNSPRPLRTGRSASVPRLANVTMQRRPSGVS